MAGRAVITHPHNNATGTFCEIEGVCVCLPVRVLKLVLGHDPSRRYNCYRLHQNSWPMFDFLRSASMILGFADGKSRLRDVIAKACLLF